MLGAASLSVGFEERVTFNGVAQAGAGAVRLDGIDLFRNQAAGGESRLDHFALGRAAGGGDTIGGAVLVGSGTANHGEDRVSFASRTREFFE